MMNYHVQANCELTIKGVRVKSHKADTMQDKNKKYLSKRQSYDPGRNISKLVDKQKKIN